MYPYKVTPRTLEELRRLSNPAGVKGQSEAVPWVFYDTDAYTSAATTRIDLFNTSRANRLATNLPSPGSLPDPQFFEIFGWYLSPLSAVEPSAWEDVSQLLTGGGAGVDIGAPTWSFQLADKEYGPFPLRQLCSIGGQTGFGLSRADATADILTYANSGQPGQCGAWWDGAVVIPPQQNFRVVLNWQSALTLTGGDMLLQVAMVGTLHRRII